jgi:hypothetical protein
MYTPDGQVVQVPEDQALAAYQSGQLGLPEGATLNIRDRAGNVRALGLDDLSGLTPDIYRVESPEETQARQLQEQHGGFGEQVLTGVESGLGAATLGGYDVLAGGFGGEEYKRERAAREAANPLAATAGEVVGTVAPLLASGGTSAVARGVAAVGAPIRGAALAGEAAAAGTGRLLARAGLTGQSILGRGVQQAARLGVGGAVEGGIYGAGQALSEAALAPDGNYDRLGERLLAGFKEGAKFGGLLGAPLGLGLGVGGGLASAAARRVGGAEGVRTAARGFSEDMAIAAIDPSKRAARELVQTGRVNKVGRELLENDIVAAGRSTDDMVARATSVRSEAGERIGQALKQLDDSGARVSKELFEAVDSEISKRAVSLSRGQQQIGKALDREMRTLRGAAKEGNLTYSELQKFRSDLGDQIDWSKVKTDPKQKAFARMYGVVEDQIEKGIASGSKAAGFGDDWLKQYKSAKNTFGAAKWAEKQLTDNLARGQANRRFGLLSTVTGAGVGPNVGTLVGLSTGSVGLGALTGAVTSFAATAATQAIRSKAPAVLAVLADRVAKADVKLHKGVRKFLRPVERSVRAETLAEGSEAQLERKAKIDKLLGTKKGENRTDAYRRKLLEITENARQGPQAIERKLGNIASVAPNAAVGMVATLSRGSGYLQSVAPTGLIDTESLVPHLEKPQVDPVSLAKFARAVQVVEDPLSVLDELEAGTLTRDHVQALRNVYPEIYNDIRMKFADELSQLKAPPAYDRRIQLGTLLELPTDKSLRPSSIATVQSIYQKPPEPPVGASAPLPRSTMAETLKSESQKLEAGGLDQP